MKPRGLARGGLLLAAVALALIVAYHPVLAGGHHVADLDVYFSPAGGCEPARGAQQARRRLARAGAVTVTTIPDLELDL